MHGLKQRPNKARTGISTVCSSSHFAAKQWVAGNSSKQHHEAAKCLSVFESVYCKRSIEGASSGLISMVERLLPSDDPVAEEVLEWTIKRDAQDISQ